jgi:hypothetical protein
MIAGYYGCEDADQWYGTGDQKEIYGAGCQRRENQCDKTEDCNGNRPNNKLLPTVPVDPEPKLLGFEGFRKADAVGSIHRNFSKNQRHADSNKEKCENYINDRGDKG